VGADTIASTVELKSQPPARALKQEPLLIFPGAQIRGAAALRALSYVRTKAPAATLKAECLYEAMRASETLRKEKIPAGLSKALGHDKQKSVFFFAWLWGAGYPAPWEELDEDVRSKLVGLLYDCPLEPVIGRPRYPAVIIEQGLDEHEPTGVSFREKYHDDACFLGTIRIDDAASENEAVAAFRTEFRRHCARKRGGGTPKWQAKLNDLRVLRISKRFRDPVRRVQSIAKETTGGFKGCREWWKEHQKAIREKREVDSLISKTAGVEIRRARFRARAFFKKLSPGEEPTLSQS